VSTASRTIHESHELHEKSPPDHGFAHLLQPADTETKHKVPKTKPGSAPFFAPLFPFRYTLALSLRYKWDFIVTISLKRNLGSRWER
jgi:hypothetical protein